MNSTESSWVSLSKEQKDKLMRMALIEMSKDNDILKRQLENANKHIKSLTPLSAEDDDQVSDGPEFG